MWINGFGNSLCAKRGSSVNFLDISDHTSILDRLKNRETEMCFVRDCRDYDTAPTLELANEANNSPLGNLLSTVQSPEYSPHRHKITLINLGGPPSVPVQVGGATQEDFCQEERKPRCIHIPAKMSFRDAVGRVDQEMGPSRPDCKHTPVLLDQVEPDYKSKSKCEQDSLELHERQSARYVAEMSTGSKSESLCRSKHEVNGAPASKPRPDRSSVGSVTSPLTKKDFDYRMDKFDKKFDKVDKKLDNMGKIYDTFILHKSYFSLFCIHLCYNNSVSINCASTMLQSHLS